jgi:hypothetical protein
LIVADGISNARVVDVYPEHANLYPLAVHPWPAVLYVLKARDGTRSREEVHFAEISGSVAVEAAPNYIRRALRGQIIAGARKAEIPVKLRRFSDLFVDTSQKLSSKKHLRIFPAFEFRVVSVSDRYFLCIDYHLKTQVTLPLGELRKSSEGFSLQRDQRVFWRPAPVNEWKECVFLDETASGCLLALPDGQTITVSNDDVVPYLTREQTLELAPSLGIPASDLEQTIKRFSFLTGANAPRARLDACTEFVWRLSQRVFPIRDGAIEIGLEPSPAKIRPPVFAIAKDLAEPVIAFDHVDRARRAKDIARGLTTFGAYEKARQQLRLTVVTIANRRFHMNRLVQQLNRGSQRYSGALATFGGEFIVRELIASDGVADYENALRGFLQTDARQDTDVALVYLPRTGATHDPAHPYHRVKSLLLREGLASQMVDEATVLDPTWRDLNLALNIYAKAGFTPWVLDGPIPEIDLFIGLSSSTVGRGPRTERTMGYVNVFDNYGRWRFYRGDSLAFAFEDRLRHFDGLIRDSVAAYRAENEGQLRSICIHLTKRFSSEERAVLAAAVRGVVPDARILFVWIDAHPIVRLYDLSEGSSGEITRATYVRDEPGRVWLATTGRNEFNQRGMGTPVLLQLTVWSDPDDFRFELRDVAQQVLSLTRLNWGSSRNFSQEPITTKYAGDIARRMSVFMRDPGFFVNPRLRGVPWFL